MWIVRVKDRGRVLAWHASDRLEDMAEIRRVYELLGYDPEKIAIEYEEPRTRAA
jgi:hypothetical protein